MSRLFHATTLLMTAGFLGLWSPSPETFGQSINIDSPTNNATVNIGPFSQPLVIKVTIVGNWVPKQATMEWTSNGQLNVLRDTMPIPDLSYPTGSGHWIFRVYPGTGSYTNCLITARAEDPVTSAPHEDYSTGVQVIKQ